MRYALVDLSRADLLGEYATLEEGRRALEELVRDEPATADEIGLLAHDDDGQPVGDPITVSLARR